MTISRWHAWAAFLAALFFLAHGLLLPATLEDIDSLNFALGIHEFDPAQHQPHPPGYPILIALARLTRAALPSDAHALAMLGAVFGALAVFPLMRIYERLEWLADGDRRSAPVVAALATVLTVTSPPYWFNAYRPMSDIPGLAFALAAQAVLVAAFVRQRLNPERTPQALAESGRLIVLGAFLSAIAIGMRSQALWLTVPMLAVVVVQRAGRGAAGALLGSAMAFGIGTLLWAVPLVVASGGVSSYLAALSEQGGEDFAGVDMLFLNPTPRRLAFSLLETFIYPWASRPLGWAVFALAVAGSLGLLRRAPRVLLVLGILSGPYLVVHLLLQETLTIRYALPLVPPAAYLVVRGGALLSALVPRLPRPALVPSLLTGALAVWSLAITLPAARVYAREGTPAFAALAELHRQLEAGPGAVGMHQGLARSVRTQDFGPAPILPAPPMREWLELGQYWRAGNTLPVWFLADPARTDLELIDPLSRRTHQHYVWSFPRLQFLSGSRPDIVDLIRIDSPPGWFAEEGWHLTPETLNLSERSRRTAGIAYVRSRPDAAWLVLGVESTGSSGEVSVQIDGRPMGTWPVAAGQRIFRRVRLKAGSLAGSQPLLRLVASYARPDGQPQDLRLTQFAVFPLDAVIAVPHAGWNEIEYSRELQRRWRWTTGEAQTFINGGGKDVTLTVSGESPLRYFEDAATATVRAGDRVLKTVELRDDFTFEVLVPAEALEASGGSVTLSTSRTFVPHTRSGSPDRRTLGLRIFDLSVR